MGLPASRETPYPGERETAELRVRRSGDNAQSRIIRRLRDHQRTQRVAAGAGAGARFPRHRAQAAHRRLVEGNPPPSGAHHRLRPPAETRRCFPLPLVFPASADQLPPHRNNFPGVEVREPPEGKRQHPAHLEIALLPVSLPERAEDRGPGRTPPVESGIPPEALRSLRNRLRGVPADRGKGGMEKGEEVGHESRALKPPQSARGTAYHQRSGVFERADQERKVVFPLGAAVLYLEDSLEKTARSPLAERRGLECQKGDYEGNTGSHQARSESDSRELRGKNRFSPIVFIEKMLNFSFRQFFVPPPQSTFGPLTGDVSMAKKKKAAKKSAKKKVAKKTAKRKPSAAFMKPMQPSAALSEVVGSKPIPRTEVTKKLWAYIKRKGLQDKKNRRNINADANLKVVFGGKGTVNMFEMTKLVSRHLK